MDHDGTPSDELAQVDYAAKVRWSRMLHGDDRLAAEMEANAHLGLNVLREETGFFGPWRGAGYSLDKATQDRLLAHTRQDVSSTYAMAKSALREAHLARRVAQRSQWLLLVAVGLGVAGLVFQWLRP